MATALAECMRPTGVVTDEHSARAVVPYKQEVGGSSPAAPTHEAQVRDHLRTRSAPVRRAARPVGAENPFVARCLASAARLDRVVGKWTRRG